MPGDAPIVKTNFTLTLMKFTRALPVTPIDNTIEGNYSFTIIFNVVNIEAPFSNVTRVSCTGNLHDKQHIPEQLARSGTCGCYGFNTNTTNLETQNTVTISSTSDTFSVDEFLLKIQCPLLVRFHSWSCKALPTVIDYRFH